MHPGQPPPGLVVAPRSELAAGQFPVEPPECAQGVLEGARVGDGHPGGQHRQMPDADIHPNHTRHAVAGRYLPLHLDGERHEPAVGLTGDGGGQNPGGALLQTTGELPCRLVRLDDPDAGELDVFAVGQHPDGAGGEPAGSPGAALLLAAREAHRAALATAVAGVAPVLERPRERVQAAVVGLLAVLLPPGRHVMLGAVPLASQLRKGPGHLHVMASLPLVEAGGDQLQAPVVGKQHRTGVGCEAALLAWGGVQRELVGLEHRGHHGMFPRFASLVMWATIGVGRDSQPPLSQAAPPAPTRA